MTRPGVTSYSILHSSKSLLQCPGVTTPIMACTGEKPESAGSLARVSPLLTLPARNVMSSPAEPLAIVTGKQISVTKAMTLLRLADSLQRLLKPMEEVQKYTVTVLEHMEVVRKYTVGAIMKKMIQ